MSPKARALGDADYARLLAFRDGLRRFLRWSEDEAKSVGLTSSQHQLLLTIRGHGGVPSVSEIAEHLLLRHHTVVELVDRAQDAGLVERISDADDQRVVRLRLTRQADAKLASLSAAHLEELSRLRNSLTALWDELPTVTR